MNEALSVSLLTRVAAAAVIWGTVAASPPVVWQLRGEGWGTPAADERSVYFTTRTHEVVAVDSETGRERWRAPTGEKGGDTFGAGAVVAGSVVAAGDWSVVAFDRASGALKWRFDPSDGYAPGPYLGSVGRGMLFSGSGGGRLHALDHETGVLKWSIRIADRHLTTVFPPVLDQDLVVAGYTEYAGPSRGGLIAVDYATGAVRWRQSFPVPEDVTLGTNAAGGPLVYNGQVIAAAGDGHIHAFDRETGTLDWSLPPVSGSPRPHVLDPRRDFRALAISGSTLMAGSLTGVVIGFDLTTRKERWRFFDEWLVSAVLRASADDNTFYLPFFSGELLALEATSGTEQWRIGDWKAGFIWPPLVWKDRLFVCATHEGLFALERRRAVAPRSLPY